jgi:hypothetical protein
MSFIPMDAVQDDSTLRRIMDRLETGKNAAADVIALAHQPLLDGRQCRELNTADRRRPCFVRLSDRSALDPQVPEPTLRA